MARFKPSNPFFFLSSHPHPTCLLSSRTEPRVRPQHLCRRPPSRPWQLRPPPSARPLAAKSLSRPPAERISGIPLLRPSTGGVSSGSPAAPLQRASLLLLCCSTTSEGCPAAVLLYHTEALGRVAYAQAVVEKNWALEPWAGAKELPRPINSTLPLPLPPQTRTTTA